MARFCLPVVIAVCALLAGCGGKGSETELTNARRIPKVPVVEPKSVADFVPSKPGTEWEFYNGLNERPTPEKNPPETRLLLPLGINNWVNQVLIT